MTGGIPSSGGGSNGVSREVVSSGLHTNAEWKVWNEVSYWYARVEDHTTIKLQGGEHAEYLITLHVDECQDKSCISWYLTFALSEQALYETRYFGKTSTLSLRVKRKEEDSNLVDVDLRHGNKRDETPVQCSGVPNHWQISKEAAKEWLTKQGDYGNISRALLQADLAYEQALHFVAEVHGLIDAICAKGEELQAKFMLSPTVEGVTT